MPEGDTIARLAAKVRDRAVGATVESMIVRHPRLATLDLTGSTLVETSSHGKHLFLHFDDGKALHIHLLMQGKVVFGQANDVEEWRRRFEITFDSGQRLIGVDIPLLHHVASDATDDIVGHLGTDLCGALDLELALTQISRDPTRPLSAALLDQRNMAGFGNIYAVDVPFICGLSPFTPVGEVDDLGALLAIGAALIRTNAVRGPQNTTGRRLHLTEHWMLNIKRRDCPLCGGDVKKLSGSKSPWQRRTAWCTRCQRDGHRVVDRARATTLLALHPARHLFDLELPNPFIGDLDAVQIG